MSLARGDGALRTVLQTLVFVDRRRYGHIGEPQCFGFMRKRGMLIAERDYGGWNAKSQTSG